MEKNFWKTKKLSEFSEEEWEAVCMRCGKCCLFKHTEKKKIYFTNQMCDGYDFKTGKCSRYATRLCEDCAKVDLRLLREEPELLPETCAYRLLMDGKDLPEYHPLVSGNPASPHKAKQTVLEIPEVHSIKERDEVLKKYLQLIGNTESAPEKEKELLTKLESLKPIPIAVYNIPQKL